MKKISIHLDPSDIARIDEIAPKQGLKRNTFIRMSVKEQLKKYV